MSDLNKETTKDYWVIGFSRAMRESEIERINIECERYGEDGAPRYVATAILKKGGYGFFLGSTGSRKALKEKLRVMLNNNQGKTDE